MHMLLYKFSLNFIHTGRCDESADVAALLGREDASTSHLETQASLDWQTDVLSHHSRERQRDPNPLHPPRQ